MDRYQYVLFPGRHHLLSVFQERYLLRALREPIAADDGTLVDCSGAQVVFAVSSADHGNTRRNPIPGHRREALIELFCAHAQISPLIYLIEDVPATDRFASYMLSEIEAEEGPALHEQNTILACSTDAVSDQFKALGFRVLPVERAPDGTFAEQRPWDLLDRLAAGEQFASLDGLIHPVTAELYGRYQLLDRVRRLHSDPLLSSEGELTDTRDYRAYEQEFDSGAHRKWKILRPVVKPGRIVDVGCGVGSLLGQIAADAAFAESDLYGIEAARPLYEQCQHRRRWGAFANPNTFFYQRNLLAGALFDEQSIDTTLTVSLCHELYSYLGERQLQDALQQIYQQSVPGGVWLNLDVCAPDDPERRVWIQPSADTRDLGLFEPLNLEDMTADHRRSALEKLTVAENFVQFMHDWRRGSAGFEIIPADGGVYFETTLRTAMEWLSKKDYLASWLSEMHESFCFYTFADWKRTAQNAGFEIDSASHSFTNPWLAENRFAPAVTLHPAGDTGRTLEWPVTNLLLVSRRPRR